MGRPVRVVYVDHCARLSGGEIALVRLLEALGNDVEAHVLLGEDGPIVPQLEATGATVEVFPMPSELRETRKEAVTPGAGAVRALSDLAGHARDVSRRLSQLRPEVVHTNSLKAAFYGGVAGRAARLPVLWHVRDRIASDYLPRPAVGLVRALSLAVPTAVVVNSEATARTLPRRSRVMYDVVPPVETPAPPREPGAPLRIGMVGRLASWKGQDVFLDAFATAFRGQPVQARLIGSAMFGEDAYEARLHEQVRVLGIEDQVDFRGFCDDVVAEMQALDVLVHASVIAEPFGQVVVEGMAARLPVVAAAAGGPAEVVHDGVDGVLVAPGDARTLAATLERLAADPALRARLADAGLETSRHYLPMRVRDEMLDVYESLRRS